MKRYEFHSALPPEELKKELDRLIRVENILLDKNGKMKIKWRGMRFLMLRRDYVFTDFSGISVTPSSVSASIGKSYDAWFENFWGRVVPDDVGGSVLKGRFVMPLWGALMLAVIGAVIVFLLLTELHHVHSLECVINWGGLTAILIYAGVKEYQASPRKKKIELFLDRKFEELEA